MSQSLLNKWNLLLWNLKNCENRESERSENFHFLTGEVALLGCGQKVFKGGCPIMVGGDFLEVDTPHTLHTIAQNETTQWWEEFTQAE